MIRFLALVFALLALVGFFTGHIGASFISAFMAVFMMYAEKRFDAMDKAYAADPRNAKPADRPTRDALSDHDCECS